jgi:hypothetical protein
MMTRQLLLVLASVAGACKPTPRSLGQVVVQADTLPIVTRIQMSPSFTVSGILSTRGCEFLIAGSEWGTLARLPFDGGAPVNIGRVPGSTMRARLVDGEDGSVLFWSDDPPVYGIISDQDAIATLPDVAGPWGDQLAGPAVPTPQGYFIAVLSDGAPTMVRRGSQMPLGVLTEGKGQARDQIGLVQGEPGTYLSWYKARSAVGHVGDTLLLVALSSGVVTGWVRPFLSPVWSDTLPRFFTAPTPEEETWTWPWIDFGGDVPRVLTLSHVGAAAVGGDGTIYALRNLSAEWREAPTPHFRIQGDWKVTSRTLDIYTPRAKLLRRFRLPPGDARWVSVDAHRLLYIRIEREILVVDLDGSAGGRCSTLPGALGIHIEDGPPPPGEFVVGDGAISHSTARR